MRFLKDKNIKIVEVVTNAHSLISSVMSKKIQKYDSSYECLGAFVLNGLAW